jgi:hypothetical protein
LRSAGRVTLEDVVFDFQLDGLAEKSGLRLVRIQMTPALPVLFKPPVHFAAPFGFGGFGNGRAAGGHGLERPIFFARNFPRNVLSNLSSNLLRNLAKRAVSGVEE